VLVVRREPRSAAVASLLMASVLLTAIIATLLLIL